MGRKANARSITVCYLIAVTASQKKKRFGGVVRTWYTRSTEAFDAKSASQPFFQCERGLSQTRCTRLVKSAPLTPHTSNLSRTFLMYSKPKVFC
uniref:Uncharacterized protein n=1 Tax=Anguilla anguilla TaxID=7936 RepID=A0A0E9TM34_ANGAN